MPSTSNRIAFLTLANRAGFFIYDHLAHEPLRKLGWIVDEVPWTAASVDWSLYAAVVIRSTWDYQANSSRFLDVLEQINRSRTRLFNGLEIVRWNINKKYLRELADRGIPIVPTTWPAALTDRKSVEDLFGVLGADEIVIKPVVGANADDTYRVSSPAPQQQTDRLISVFARKECMVQPFLSSIVTTGEYSLFHFGGVFSHAVVKFPATGDFRVQEEHGGAIRACTPSAELLAAADRTVAALPQPVLYSRVDLVALSDGQWGVIEVELIEPSLYFPYDDESPTRFAEALEAAIRR